MVQHDAADELHVEVAHVEGAPPGLADQGKRRDQCRIDRIAQLLLVVRIVALEPFHAALHLGLEGQRPLAQLGVGKLLHLRLEGVDLSDQRLNALDVALMLGADEARDDTVYYPFYIHVVWFRGPSDL